MKKEYKTNYVAPETVPVQIELEQCIAQSELGTLNGFENNILFDESFTGII
ncbi:MAG: hypothetical protein II841_12500 [Bacteroidales bacterium]|nr:hypothetical protein [Bacteroidales bacterium]